MTDRPVGVERRGRGRPQAVASDVALTTARRMLVEQSAASFSIRRLADALSVTPGVLYARFGTRNELLAQAYLQGLRELNVQLRTVGSAEAESLEDLLRDLSVPLSRLRTDFAVRFEVEGGPAHGVRSSTWRELRQEYLKLIRRVYALIRRAAAAQGHHLMGGSLAERLVWSLLSSGTSDRNAAVYGHRNSAYFRFLAQSMVAALSSPGGRPGRP